MAFNSGSARGAFVPTTNVWDVGEIYQLGEQTPDDLKELLVRLYQNLNLIALNVNIRDAGYYNQLEFVNGQKWFPNPNLNSSTAQEATFRQVYRMTVNFGALPNNTTKSVAHNIPIMNGFSFTRIFATASNITALTFIPIPYASTTAANVVELNVDSANVNITTHSDMTAYTICYVVLEYIKQ